MSINRAYTRELRDNLNYTATWLPNLKLSLGDVGILSDYQFNYRTNLKSLGIPFKERPSGAPATYSHISSDAVDRTLKLAGKAPIPGSALTAADAGLVFTFKQKEAVVFLATECAIQTIADQDALKHEILVAYSAGRWQADYVVVTELVSAGRTSVIISEGSNARYELRAKAGLAPTFEAMNVNGNFSLAHDSQIGFHFLADDGLTPLFRCLGVRKSWGRPDVVTRAELRPGQPGSEEQGNPAESLAVDEVDYDDFTS